MECKPQFSAQRPEIQKAVRQYLNTFNEVVLEIVDVDNFQDFGENTLARIVNLVHQVAFMDQHSIFSGVLPLGVYYESMDMQNRTACNENIKKCNIVGWIMMMYIGSILIIDDYQDQSDFRGKRESWNKISGRNTVHDSALLYRTADALLRKQSLKDNSGFTDSLILESIKCRTKAAIGFQYERIIKRKVNLKNLNESWKQYHTIQKYKNAPTAAFIVSFVSWAMKLAGIQDPDAFKQAANICNIAYERCGKTDDYMDVFAGEHNNSDYKDADLYHAGNDIENGTLSLCILTALEMANEEQKDVLLKNYGRGSKNPECAETVGQVFSEIKLSKTLLEAEAAENQRFHTLLSEAPFGVPVDFLRRMHSVYCIPRNPSSDPDKEDIETNKLFTDELLTIGDLAANFSHTFGDILIMLSVKAENGEDKGDLEFSSILPWVTRLLCYNVPLGKKARGYTVALTHNLFSPNATQEELKLACYAGWATEMIQAAALIVDDLQDRSVTRRGRPCWYLKDKIGRKAVKDAELIFRIVWFILDKMFKSEPYYHRLTNIIYDIKLKTIVGQGFDILNDLEKNFEKYTSETYQAIVKYKTAFYTFYLPVAGGMILADALTPERDAQIKPLLLEIGSYFQAQDDFLDCYGDEKTIGKVGTDIPDGKCSWLVVSALELANESQKQTIYEHYGKGLEDKESIQKIKDLYQELDLEAKFTKYEEDIVEIIRNQIDLLDNFTEPQKKLFHSFVSAGYKRQA